MPTCYRFKSTAVVGRMKKPNVIDAGYKWF